MIGIFNWKVWIAKAYEKFIITSSLNSTQRIIRLWKVDSLVFFSPWASMMVLYWEFPGVWTGQITKLSKRRLMLYQKLTGTIVPAHRYTCTPHYPFPIIWQETGHYRSKGYGPGWSWTGPDSRKKTIPDLILAKTTQIRIQPPKPTTFFFRYKRQHFDILLHNFNFCE